MIKKPVRIAPHDKKHFGHIMHTLIKDQLFDPKHPELKSEMNEQLKFVINGEWTYLFDSNENFLNDSARLIEDEEKLLSDSNGKSSIFNR